MNILKELRSIFGKAEKRKFVYLCILMLIGAVAEMLSISLILPLIGIISDPNIINTQKILHNIYEITGFSSVNAFIVLLSFSLLIAYIMKNCFMIFYYIYQNKLIFIEQAKLSHLLLSTYLRKPYEFHLKRNSSELLRNVNTEVSQLISGVILPGTVLISDAFVVICILVLLIIVDPFITILATVFLGASSILFLLVFKKRIDIRGKKQQFYGGLVFKWVTQSLNAIKEIKVLGKELFFLDNFNKQTTEYAKCMSYNNTLIQMPRLFIESISILCITFIVGIVVIQGRDLKSIVPLFAVFGLSAVRLMPSMNRIIGSITTIRYYKPSVDIIYKDLTDSGNNVVGDNVSDNSSTEEIKFNKTVEILNLSYKYPDTEEIILNKISLVIPFGKSIAFIGASGAGKTTIVDIILGLLKQTEGKILADGYDISNNLRAWQNKIGYVPQMTYLSDDSIRRNIAFGVGDEQIKDEQVWKVLDLAQLREFVEKLSDGLDNVVGERGVRLSGGQRQRIGIARALYHEPEILVLDEATSALDNETEKGIMKSIEILRGKKTIIIIAHRLSTIENCDIVYKIKNGNLVV